MVRAFCLAVPLAASVALGLPDSGGPWWPLAIEPIASPAARGSMAPGLTVSDRGVLLSWLERQGETATLKFAERTRTGWSSPITVSSGSNLFVNWADVPSVLRLADGQLAAHWLQKSGPGTYAYDVRLAYSRDDGRTWSRSFTPHHDGTATEHGFASLFQMPGAGLGLIWLDGRATGPHAGHGGGAGEGAMALRFGSFDREWRQTAELVVDDRVCDCCPTAAAVTPDGIVAAFRNRSDSDVRDIYVTRFAGGAWSEGKPVHEDGWRIPACPVNGPMLSARGRDVAIAWFTVLQEEGRAFVAFSEDAGRTFGAPIRLDDRSSLGRVDLELLPDGSAVATYIEFADGRSALRARRVERSGARSSAITVSDVDGGRSSGYPRVATHGDELVFAWTESREGAPQIRTASARLPRRP